MSTCVIEHDTAVAILFICTSFGLILVLGFLSNGV